MSPNLNLLIESLQGALRQDSHEKVAQLLQSARTEDVAVAFRFLDERWLNLVFDLLPDDEARSSTLTELDEHLLPMIFEGRSTDQLAPLITLMDVDDQADVLALVPPQQRQEIIARLHPEDVEDLEDILTYEEDTAGGIMSTDFVSFTQDTTVERAISTLQRLGGDVEMVLYLYVVNEEQKLMGAISLRQLVINPPERKLSELMATELISARLDTDQEEVARMIARYNLLAIPVLDAQDRMVGVVTIDDAIDVIREEATEDILRMAGVDETAYETYSLKKNFRVRAPWLGATWLAGLSASMLLGAFEETLESTVALAVFIPIVLGMGGNVGTQTATIMVRGIATGRVGGEIGVRYLLRETAVGAMMGVLYGVLLSAYAYIRYSDLSEIPYLALTVGIAIMATMINAATIGAIVPLILHRFHVDPAVATNPIVTTTVDVTGILIYFVSATILLGV